MTFPFRGHNFCSQQSPVRGQSAHTKSCSWSVCSQQGPVRGQSVLRNRFHDKFAHRKIFLMINPLTEKSFFHNYYFLIHGSVRQTYAADGNVNI